jgi:hypothetical protein
LTSIDNFVITGIVYQKVEYYMSQTSRKVLETLTQDYLWIRAFNSMPPSKLTEQLIASKKQFQHASTTIKQQQQSLLRQQQQQKGSGGREIPPTMTNQRGAASGMSTRDADSSSNAAVPGFVETLSTLVTTVGTDTDSNSPTKRSTTEWDKAVSQLSEIATEQLAETMIQASKKHVFS